MVSPANSKLANGTTLLLASFLCGEVVLAGENPVVYFIPTDIETYVAVTKASIEADATEQWIVSNPSQADELRALLKHAVKTRQTLVMGEFGQNHCSIIKLIFIDSEGVVQHQRETRSFNIADFEKLRDLLTVGLAALVPSPGVNLTR